MKTVKKVIAEILAPWIVLGPIALGLGFVIEPFLHRVVHGNPAEKVFSMVAATVVVFAAAILLRWAGEKLSRYSGN